MLIHYSVTKSYYPGALSDAVVVWRAWVLFQQDRLWKITLALFMIVNIGVQSTH